MRIEVYSDAVCPWCYVGLARLEQALAARPGKVNSVHWLPFELNPAMAEEGADRQQYMREKFGDTKRFAAAQVRLQQLGSELGLDYQFERVTRMVNTRRAHMLIEHAGETGALQTQVKCAIMRAYFTEGRDIGKLDVLLDIARETGLNTETASLALQDTALRARVVALEEQAGIWGISGVPTFIFDRRYAFSGAQELSVFTEMIDRISAEAESNAL